MTIRLKLALLISFLFISAIGNTFLNFQVEKNGEQKLSWVIHTNKVLMQAELLMSYIKDAETGQRGYLITNDQTFLTPFYHGTDNAEKSFRTLLELTKDNPVQQNRLLKIGENIQLKFIVLKETINLMRKSREAAFEQVKNGTGRQHMDNLRILVDEFVNDEKILLERRNGDLRENKGMLFTLIVVEVMFFIFLALFTFFFISKNLFIPLKTLLMNTKKMEHGREIKVSDILANDEMGYLLSCFYSMYQKVHEYTKSLSHQASHDELTGLKNRVSLIDTLNTQISAAINERKKLAVLFLDLNKFKAINDTYGHEAGDALLIETSNRLIKTIRDEDLIFRLGGDEFVILIKNLASSSEIKTIISKILRSFQENTLIQNIPLKISISIGVAVAPDDSQDADELLKMADLAMYIAKKEKEDNYKFFETSMYKRIDDKK